jgi:hypothetical protein
MPGGELCPRSRVCSRLPFRVPPPTRHVSHSCGCCRAQVAKRFQAGIAQIPGLEVIGNPEMCNVAFKATHPRSLDIYKVRPAPWAAAPGALVCACASTSPVHGGTLCCRWCERLRVGQTPF